MSGYVMARDELARIIEEASTGCAERNRTKLRRVVQTTDAVAVGWFHHDGVRCPARQARYRHQGFQERFDRAMFARFGRSFDICDSFVVRIVPDPGGER